MPALNPSLFKALERTFRHVRIASPGCQSVVRYRPNWDRGRKLSADVSSGGEYYCVNCPFCNDIQHRLWIHHLWGTTDEKTSQEFLHLAHCYNEGCIDCRDRQIQLREMVFAYGREAATPLKHTSSLAGSPSPPPPIRLPTGRVPINAPECPAHAKQYLEERGFDLDELWKRWRVSYCRNSSSSSPKVTDRIIIPVYQPNRRLITKKKEISLAGWQARIVRDDGGSTKYLNARGMSKSAMLYGLTRAIRTEGPVVICEGVTDVWRLGSGAVSLFGKTLSTRQLSLLSRHFKGRPLVILLDRDASKNARKTQKLIQSRRRTDGDRARVVVASLPDNRGDVGECDRGEAWNCVTEALEKRPSELTRG